jgi:hypothetical protein
MTRTDRFWGALPVFNLVAGLTLTLAEIPADRSSWASPTFLALSLWFVSVLCRWPIPEGICSDGCPDCERSER